MNEKTRKCIIKDIVFETCLKGRDITLYIYGGERAEYIGIGGLEFHFIEDSEVEEIITMLTETLNASRSLGVNDEKMP